MEITCKSDPLEDPSTPLCSVEGYEDDIVGVVGILLVVKSSMSGVEGDEGGVDGMAGGREEVKVNILVVVVPVVVLSIVEGCVDVMVVDRASRPDEISNAAAGGKES